MDLTNLPSLGAPAYCSCGAAWSPDGEHVAFVRTTDTTRVAIVRPDGSDARIIEGVEIGQGDPQWSPDGTRVLAESRLTTNDSEPGMVVIDPTGETPPMGIPGSGAPSWQRVAP